MTLLFLLWSFCLKLTSQLDATVFQAEVAAIHQACKKLQEMKVAHVTIFSDSQAALQALASNTIDSTVVQNCVDTLNDLAKRGNIELRWVKAHADHSGNEFADMEAKTGTTNVENRIICDLPYSHVKAKIKANMIKRWNKRWTYRKDCRQTKIWLPVIDEKKSKTLIKLGRNSLGFITQMLTGHNRLNRHESLVCEDDTDPTCRFCLEEEETSFHVIGDCPALINVRLDSFQKRLLDEFNPDWSISQLLKFCELTKLEELNAGALNDQ